MTVRPVENGELTYNWLRVLQAVELGVSAVVLRFPSTPPNLVRPGFSEDSNDGTQRWQAIPTQLALATLRAEGIEDSPAVKSMMDQHAAWQDRLPENEAALWDWLLAQDSAVVTGLSPIDSPAP